MAGAVLFLMLGGVIGVVIGRWWAACSARRAKAKALSLDETLLPAVAENATDPAIMAQAQDIVLRLQDLAAGVAADVDQHNIRVQEINEELITSNASADAVIAAVAQLIEANEVMQKRLNQAEQRLQDQAKQIESQAAEARTDALTSVANRRAFDDEMARCEQRLREEGQPFSVMMLDVDHFKKFNDTHGHLAGDEVLRGVARVLCENTSDDHLVARYGGEEFAVIFRNVSLQAARPIAERARAAVARSPFLFEGNELRVTASSGLAQSLSGESSEALVRRADEALYAAKKNGRNRGFFHDGQECHPLIAEEAAPSSPPRAPESVKDEESQKPSPPPAPVAKKEPVAVTRSDSASVSIAPTSSELLKSLAGREDFLNDLERRLDELRRVRSPLSIMLIEIDNYQEILRDSGGETSDVILRATAQFLKAAMRTMDHVARFREDTFSLLVPNAGSVEAVRAAERLRRAIERCKLPRKYAISNFTISVGVTEANDMDSTESLLERVEDALGAARRDRNERTYVNVSRELVPASDYLASDFDSEMDSTFGEASPV